MSDAGITRAARLAQLPLVPSGPKSGFVRGTLGSVKGVWEYRELLGLLVRRELKSRYKDSALGFLWSLVRPLMTMIVYVVAIGLFLGASYNSITKTGTVDFPVYIFAGLTVWNLFSEIVGVGTGAIINNGGLVKKIYLPREVFPLSVIGSALFNFLIQIVILYIATWFTRFHPTPQTLIWALAGTLLVLVWATALAFLLSAVNVYLRDVAYLVEIVLLFGFWLSPVVYQLSAVQEHLTNGLVNGIYMANPVTLAVLAFHRAFWVDGFQTPVTDLPLRMGLNFAAGLIALWLCQRVFARLQSNFAQEI
ncbi:ABC-2 type transport system permease protein [Nakamurella panacisegetis]|uniref:Transport permease protein n=1 Tax=Nakamurella panacisegetis TaxID=1090615 RepID=A0A1H0PIN8_9ACTN|nr:ABC transporter permease [Nakamurella panacisegetis]SDP04528.1 ABC-2 type transport system permease protein [Nakamurella panacisegetis]